MYATSMKDRILAAAKTKARELQEAALPGTAAKELEEALDAGDDDTSKRFRAVVDDPSADIEDDEAEDIAAGAEDLGHAEPTDSADADESGRRAAS